MYKMTCLIKDLMSRSRVRFGTSGARGMLVDMSDEVCYAYSAVFLQIVVRIADKVVLGHDLRPSSSVVTAACAAATRFNGCNTGAAIWCGAWHRRDFRLAGDV